MPRQQSHDAPADVVLQDATNLRAYRVIVEREVVHSEDAVEFDEFQNLRRLGMKSFISWRRNYTAWVHDNGNQCKGFPAQTIEEQVRSIVS